MFREKQRPPWSVLVILICLFVLSVTAPRSWQRIARSKSAEQSLAEASVQDPPPAVDFNPAASMAIPTPSENASTWESGWKPATPASRYAGPSSLANPPVQLPLLELTENEASSAANGAPDSEAARVALRSTSERRRTQPPAAPQRNSTASGGTSARPKAIWQSPETLYRQLAALAAHRQTADWATRTEKTIRRLGQATGEPAGQVEPACQELVVLLKQAEALARRLGFQPLASEVRRAAYSLRRRLELWQPLLAAGDQPITSPSPQALAMAAADVLAVAGNSPEGRAWREYLLLDALRSLTDSKDTQNLARREAMARHVLTRVAHARLDPVQRQFLQSEPLARLGTELSRAAAGSLNRADVLQCVECYEQSGLPSDAQRLAEQCLWLGLGESDVPKQVSRRLALHYRNANVRIALAEPLLNRMIPKRPVEYAPVRDTVLGRPVRGESLTETAVAIRLVPDAQRLLLALEITGDVAATTSSTSGPATFHNASQSHYVARKPVEITMNGLVLAPAEVEQVDNFTRLRALRTDFDGIPLVGSLIYGVARSQHDAKRAELRREVEQKVSHRAKQRIDTEADERLSDLSHRLQTRLFEPLSALALGPTLVEANTTEQRLVMRLRLASRRQLGAHTPRPRAPGDSLASIQVHQTAMNNLLERLELADQTLSLPELRQRLATRLGRPELDDGSTPNDDVTITFASRDPVHVSCKDGRVTIALAVTELRKSPRAWYDFRVWVSYRPEVDGLSVRFVRDGVVHLDGDCLSSGSQVALRSVFSKIFAKNRSRQLIPERIRNEPNLADLGVTQMRIADGWFALALGPARPAMARSPISPVGR